MKTSFRNIRRTGVNQLSFTKGAKTYLVTHPYELALAGEFSISKAIRLCGSIAEVRETVENWDCKVTKEVRHV